MNILKILLPWLLALSTYAQEIGFVDTVQATGTGIYVTGWAADSTAGTPASSVTVQVSVGADVLAGPAVLGSPRPDVVAAFGKSGYLNSGWTFVASELPPGTYTVMARATGLSGTGPLTGSRTVVIVAPGPPGPPVPVPQPMPQAPKLSVTTVTLGTPNSFPLPSGTTVCIVSQAIVQALNVDYAIMGGAVVFNTAPSPGAVVQLACW